jgi:hypothetical protein
MRRVPTALCGAIASAVSLTGAAAGDITAGREAAGQHCTRCHIVGDLNTVSIGSTPSFQYMVNHVDDFENRFLTFYTLRPHPAFVRIEGIPPLNDLPSPIAPIELTLQQVEDIAAFAATLKEE